MRIELADDYEILTDAWLNEWAEQQQFCWNLPGTELFIARMRAASIHVMPVPGKCKALGTGDNAGHHVFESSEMEWSVATVAVNPDAYAKSLSADSKLSEVLALQLESANRILESGRVGGRPLLPSLVPAPQGRTQEDAYVEGVATGCFGRIGLVVLAIIGFVAGYALVGVAHENEWFYTQEGFKNRHGLSDDGLAAWGNMMTGGLVGAVLLPIAVAATYEYLRSHKNHGRK